MVEEQVSRLHDELEPLTQFFAVADALAEGRTEHDFESCGKRDDRFSACVLAA
ncbi:hypothetical protein ACIA5G_52565 [Amycolatopsis sp. NPDC051758]|uniref:hypothetical protein n=1 Tax=Amycolatopsis sp. NPDC051758 TaxID=3363935 RepID=UPI0037A43469